MKLYALLVNRSDRPLEKIDTDFEANLEDVDPVGAWALANPDFVERLKTEDAQLIEPGRTIFYGGGSKGYTDYPLLNLSNMN
ncbi:hypothetical protein ABES23_14530 [Peribacillus frigoritolerans]|uniref:hypothetical protein n=1 Tax=Peribacillus frigoritolerans TaxID=450367 RepID=UPI003D2DBBAE